ncbi:MAG: coenzyme F420-0:L-glutamate ligase [Bacillota bacterium]|nr:coenzyme F420-0:L-glutamate ligase [Bacillota bacterium]MDW7684675.1 coenzyme F420-0:L-glutamate ligase [Bacillota bacterium]
MPKLPDYIGPTAFGVKMGVIVPGSDLTGMIVSTLKHVAEDELLDSNDVICVTESVVARAQNNFVSVDEVAAQLRSKLGLKEDSRIGVVFPITSRNRFAMILEGIARAVPQGEVIVQLPFPCDEVGNQIVSPEIAETFDLSGGLVCEEDLYGVDCSHPITRVNYLEMYRDIIEAEGATARIFLANDPKKILNFAPDGVIAADIHSRKATLRKISEEFGNCITLQDLCREGSSWSEWGLLGSNMSANKKLKLAPRNASAFAKELQEGIYTATGRQVEVLVYGDGAYKDPSTGIYELADPMPVFGATEGFGGRYRDGIKYKYVADVCHEEGKSVAEIEAHLAETCRQAYEQGDMITEGTTPRRVEDVIASLADLVSGSADAGTPVIVVKRILR